MIRHVFDIVNDFKNALLGRNQDSWVNFSKSSRSANGEIMVILVESLTWRMSVSVDRRRKKW